jgi:ribosomal protein S8
MFTSSASGLNVRLKIGGSYLTSGYYSQNIRQRQSSTTYDYGVFNNTGFAGNVSGGDMDTSAVTPACVELRVSKPAVNKFQQVAYDGRTVLSGSSVDRSIGGSITNTTQGVLTGIRLYADAGNITGTFRLYGYSK